MAAIMKMAVCVLIILFGLVAADKPVSGYGVPKPSGYGVPKPSETYTPTRVPSYVLIERPEPSKHGQIKAKISSKKEAFHHKLEELKPKIEAKIYSTKEAIATKLEALKPKVEAFKAELKYQIPVIKAKISDKISDLKSKFKSKHAKPNHHVVRYVLVAAAPQPKHKW